MHFVFYLAIIVAICRRKSTRLAAFLGGLILSLACLLPHLLYSFIRLIYGLVLGVGAGVVRETSTIVLGHYFKEEFVEMIAQRGTGVGMSPFSDGDWAFQATTGLFSVRQSLPPPTKGNYTFKNPKEKDEREKNSHRIPPKPPNVRFQSLKGRGLGVITMGCAFAALGIYAPVFCLIYQGSRGGLGEKGMVKRNRVLGVRLGGGCVGFGLAFVGPRTKIIISRKNFCKAAVVEGAYFCYLKVLFGVCPWLLFFFLGVWDVVGGIHILLKDVHLGENKGATFCKAWSFIQGAKSIPVLLGIPITGYINQTYAKAGYYFSASLMFLVGTGKDHNSVISAPTSNCNLNNCAIANLNLNDCVCPLGPYNRFFTSDLHSYPFYKTGSNHYERIFTNYNGHFDKSNLRHSYMHKLEPIHHYLPKRMNYCRFLGITLGIHFPRKNRPVLRPSKSVPEGLARWQYCPSYGRPVRNIQVVEQITTSPISKYV
ncbi:hypothetical protein NQ317_006623 [Molorchus minor]|uniref:Uncharacterized protein n=1 Tax=Molorchus minor TaxID=1323400 RepID=A0ABQ9K0F2_9CUCU|nr:hypothetical protein NQ317_006623 [Molorchus minor]